MKDKKKGLKLKEANTNTWFPPIDLISSLYSDKSELHGLSHVLRVWLLSFIISNYYKDKADINIVTAGALLHDLGRRTNLAEPRHGERSAELVAKIIPLISDEFDQKKLKKVQKLCAMHARPDPSKMTLEEKILKDADGLDRWRLPLGKPKASYLRLPESLELMDFSKELLRMWNQQKKRYKNPFQILKSIAKTLEIYDTLPKDLQNQLKKRTPTYKKTQILKASRILRRFDRIAQKIRDYTDWGTMKDGWIEKLLATLENPRSFNITDRTLRNIVMSGAKRLVNRSLRYTILDQTYEKTTRSLIKDLYKSTYNSDSYVIDEIPQSIVFELAHYYKEHPTSHKHLFKYMLNILSQKRDSRSISLLLTLANHPAADYFMSLTGKIPKSLETNYLLHPISGNENFNIFIVESIVEILGSSSIQKKLVIKAGNQAIRKIRTILIYGKLDIFQCQKLMDLLLRILEMEKKMKYGFNVKPILHIWLQDFRYMLNINFFKKGKVLYNANLFNLYNEIDKEEVRKCFKTQLRIARLIKDIGLSADDLLDYYLLPAALDSDIGSVSDIMAISKLASSKNLKTSIDFYLDLKKKEIHQKSPYYSHIIDYVKEKSRKNVREVLKDLNIKKLPNYKINKNNNYRVVLNFIDVDILQKIVENETSVISVWNVIAMKNIFKKVFTPVIEIFMKSSYPKRTTYRDSVQRLMKIRFPNISEENPIYGSLQSLDILLRNKNKKENEEFESVIHFPIKIFLKRRFGEVILVFKKDVSERSIFVFLDSIWKYRKYPVDIKRAIYLKKILSRYAHRIVIKENPASLATAYIEAIIFGDTSLNSVDKILVPKRTLRRKRKFVEMVNEKYPHIEIIPVN